VAVDLGGFGIMAFLVALANLAVFVGVVVLAFLGVRWLVRNSGGGTSGRPPMDDPALAALRDRFARGEIDAQEFEERRRVLGG
jgi:putative membrane protein